VFDVPFDRTICTAIDVPATDMAVDVGNVMTASMVMLGAYAAVTKIVALDALEEAVADALPSYRTQHAALNVAALRAGHESVPRAVAPAWTALVSP
jgi:Pyruvate/2-oxoacid:ferredoxin oxidoreductase gamma subunit